jgi:hypothetical protein
MESRVLDVGLKLVKRNRFINGMEVVLPSLSEEGIGFDEPEALLLVSGSTLASGSSEFRK